MNSHLRSAPHKGDNDSWWWYETPTGIDVVVEQRDNDGKYTRTTIHTIRWQKLRSALSRRDKGTNEEVA